LKWGGKVEKIHIICVSTIHKREQLIQKILDNLIAKNTDATHILIIKDRPNRIRVLHNAGNGITVSIKTILFVVIPIMINIEPLESFEGDLFFDLDDLIISLRNIIAQLESKSGKQIVRRSANAEDQRLVTDIPEFYV